jgi:tRNA1(Val) A37 N6-methylase TrmN6
LAQSGAIAITNQPGNARGYRKRQRYQRSSNPYSKHQLPNSLMQMIRFHQADLFHNNSEKYDLIISNSPLYSAPYELQTISDPHRDHEPRMLSMLRKKGSYLP